MSRAGAGFDRMARGYRALELLAFGGDLERARFALLPRLSGCRDILLLGEGDGRCSERLAQLCPQARITCVDSSAGMIAQALARTAPYRNRVNFVRADAMDLDLQPGGFDAVATLFFLDCFTPDQAAALIRRLSPGMRPPALWLYADFALPARGLARLRARAWLRVLYAFFRWEAGIGARRLPPAEDLLAAEGWLPSEAATFQGGLLRSVVFSRAPTGGPAASP
ncbi:MAG TPA: class I SAM-dependent methyltransferase [Opitutaceae bacterium]|jgi:predicted O-methyltransferase YrrM